MSSSLANVVTINSTIGTRNDNSDNEITTKTNKKSVVAITLSELFACDLPEANILISPWLRSRSLNMLHAWRGVGKSHVALGIAYAAATGGKFLYWEAVKPISVLYIDGEMQGSDLKKRLMAIHATAGNADPLVMSNLRIVTPDLQVGKMLDLADRDWQIVLDEEVKGAELIIIDNLSCLARSGGKENDSDSWEPVLEWGLRMRREGRAVLFVHHSGKNGLQRGTSRREDALNVVIKLSNPPEYSPENGALFQVHFEKGRELFGQEARPFEAHLITLDNGLQKWTVRPIEDSISEKIIEKHKLGLKPFEIAEELGVNKSTVSRHMKAAGIK